MIIVTVFMWLGWFFIILKIDPLTTDWVGLAFFYFTLGISVSGTLSIIGTVIRRWFKPTELVSRQVLISFRQSIWLSLIIIIALILTANELFHLWIITLVIFIFAFLELAFLSTKRRPLVFE